MADPRDDRRDDPWADDPHDPDEFGGDAPNPEDGPHADLGTYASDREVQAPNPKASVGTGVRVLVWLMIGGGILGVLCCGGLFWEYGASGLATPDDTPAGVRARTDEILTIDLPDDFTPLVGVNAEIPGYRWLGDARMGLAAYAAPGDGQFVLMKIRLPASLETQRSEIETKLKQTVEENSGGPRVTVAETRTRVLPTADGRSVDWRFSEGTGRGRDGADLGAFRQVDGEFVDGTDSYLVRLAIPEADYDEAEIVAMLQSIELVDPQTEPVPAGKEAVMEEAGVELQPADAGANDAGANDAGANDADAAADAGEPMGDATP